MMTLNIVIPMRTVSAANAREGVRTRIRRVRRERDSAFLHVRSYLNKTGMATFKRIGVVLTRRAPRQLDGDNLQYALKAVRDGVAKAIGIDDGDGRYTWEYAQYKCAEYGVGVLIVLS